MSGEKVLIIDGRRENQYRGCLQAFVYAEIHHGITCLSLKTNSSRFIANARFTSGSPGHTDRHERVAGNVIREPRGRTE